MADGQSRGTKKAGRSKRSRRTKGGFLKAQLIKISINFAILIALVLIVVGLTRFLLQKPVTPPMVPPISRGIVPSEAHLSKPAYEIFPKIDRPPSIPVKPDEGGRSLSDLPKVAIILDDVGYDLRIAKRFLELKGPFTFAVLPKGPFNKTIIELAHLKGFEIMLHLPMEPKEYPKVNPGPGALLTTMDPDQLIAQLNENLLNIPYLKGVNNHMGSRMTGSSNQMRQIFTILKKKGLFFIDSRTSSDTICRSSAELLQLPFAERDVFIDHFVESQFIQSQIHKLIGRALKNGQAVGIAHPHRTTFDTLQRLLPKLEQEVQLVPASQVVQQ